MRKILIIAATFLLAACATSPYTKYYHDKTGGADVTKLPYVVITKGKPRVMIGNTVNEDIVSMEESGYGLVGYSSFNAGTINENRGAVAQARKVHASVVILYSRYTNTVSGSVPLTLPNTQTSTTSMNGNVIGSGGGFATYSGNAYTTTYGTSTTYIPYSVRRYDYFATYWVKLKPQALGVFVRPLTPEIKQEIGSDQGMDVIAVVNGSPAFKANIIEGDVIQKIGEVAIYSINDLHEAEARYQGKSVNVLIDRKGKKITTKVLLGMVPK